MDFSEDDTSRIVVAVLLGFECDREFQKLCEQYRIDIKRALAAPLDTLTQADISNRRLN